MIRKFRKNLRIQLMTMIEIAIVQEKTIMCCNNNRICIISNLHNDSKIVSIIPILELRK